MNWFPNMFTSNTENTMLTLKKVVVAVTQTQYNNLKIN